MDIKSDHVEKFKRDCLSDISFFAENDVAPLYIAPEEGPINRVKLRRVQKRLADCVNRQWFNRGFLRVVVCKARRIGSTTFFSMDAFRQASLNPNTNVVVQRPYALSVGVGLDLSKNQWNLDEICLMKRYLTGKMEEKSLMVG